MYTFRIRSVYLHVPVEGIPNCQPSKLLRIIEGTPSLVIIVSKMACGTTMWVAGRQYMSS